MTLGKMLKYARENADLTQKAVKEKTNINNKTLSNWEHDVSNPAPSDLKILAKLYNVTVDYLLGLEAPSSPIKSTANTPAFIATTLPALSPEALEVARIYDSVDRRGKQAIMNIAKNEASNSAEAFMEEATVS